MCQLQMCRAGFRYQGSVVEKGRCYRQGNEFQDQCRNGPMFPARDGHRFPVQEMEQGVMDGNGGDG